MSRPDAVTLQILNHAASQKAGRLLARDGGFMWAIDSDDRMSDSKYSVPCWGTGTKAYVVQSYKEYGAPLPEPKPELNPEKKRQFFAFYRSGEFLDEQYNDKLEGPYSSEEEVAVAIEKEYEKYTPEELDEYPMFAHVVELLASFRAEIDRKVTIVKDTP